MIVKAITPYDASENYLNNVVCWMIIIFPWSFEEKKEVNWCKGNGEEMQDQFHLRIHH